MIRAIQAHYREDSGAANMARVVGNDAAVITQATISTITCKVFNAGTGAQVVDIGSLTVSAVVYDTLQTDARWTEDSTGYNFRHDIAATAFPAGGIRTRVEYKFTPASGQVFWAEFEGPVREIFTS